VEIREKDKVIEHDRVSNTYENHCTRLSTVCISNILNLYIHSHCMMVLILNPKIISYDSQIENHLVSLVGQSPLVDFGAVVSILIIAYVQMTSLL